MHFLETFDQKLRFFGARSPLKISIYWRLRKIFRVGHQILISQNSTKGGPFGSVGGRIPERKGVPPPHLNPPLLEDKVAPIFNGRNNNLKLLR